MKIRATSAATPTTSTMSTIVTASARPRSDRGVSHTSDSIASLIRENQATINNDFTIPELPIARKIVFVLIAPWDDPFYIGLDAIEIFTANGSRPEIVNIETDAAESYGDVRNILNCSSFASRSNDNCDSRRGMWMCKYRGCSHEPDSYGNSVTQLPITITVTFSHRETIAMIRIWNYSESRVHAPRGVCKMRIDIDSGACIFRGEISCAFTNITNFDDPSMTEPRPTGDTILFTTNDEILNRIAEHDVFLEDDSYALECAKFVVNDEKCPQPKAAIKRLEKLTENFEETSSEMDSLRIRDKPQKTRLDNNLCMKPGTADSMTSIEGYERIQPVLSKATIININSLADIKRPATGSAQYISSASLSPAYKRNATDSFSFDDNKSTKKRQEDKNSFPKAKNPTKQVLPLNNDYEEENVGECISGKVFHMELLANWGASDFIGLTGIQFLGPRCEALSVENCVVQYNDNDLFLSSTEADTKLLSLINGNNLTCSADEMWLQDWKNDSVTIAESAPPIVTFTFAKEVQLTGVSIWNYNASSELSYCGVKCVQFYINSRPICGPVLLRRAPGMVYFDYVQDILFDRCHLFRPLSSRPATKSISAFLFELRLLSSWGDEYYIGLNGVELFNRKNQLIRLKSQNLAAFPESVNVLPSVTGDPRSSDKLIDNVNDTKKPHHMWLTPLLPNNYARVFFIFDAPEFVSRIRIYNYRKTSQRGVRHIAITADDLIIFSGEVPQSDNDHTGILDVSLRDLD